MNEDGNPVDAWGNVKVLENPEENIDPKVDNPDMATPPQDVDDGEEEGTTWDTRSRVTWRMKNPPSNKQT